MKARQMTKPSLFEFTSVFVSVVCLHRKECVHLCYCSSSEKSVFHHRLKFSVF